MKYRGCFYTWNNKQEGGDRVFFKLDRVLSNEEWADLFPNAIVEFLTECLFYHSPAIITLNSEFHKGKCSFRYYNWWLEIENFHDSVRNDWQEPVMGNPMFQVVTKLKRLKTKRRQLTREKHPNIEVNDREA